MKYRTIALLGAVCCLSIQATNSHRFTFIKENFDDFVDQVEFDLSKQKSFKDYYHNVEQQLATYTAEKKKLAKREIYQHGLIGLKKEHHDWYTAITPFITEPIYTLDNEFNDLRNTISEFVTRYGLFANFQQKQQVVHQEEKPSTFKKILKTSTVFLQKAGSSIKTVSQNTYSWIRKKIQRTSA